MNRAMVVLRRDDADRLAKLHVVAGADAWTAASWASTLELPTTLALGHERADGQIDSVICAQLAGDFADILMVFVDPDLRRTGLAHALVSAMLRRAAERGIARIGLDVDAGNAPARQLYAGLAFSQDGRRANYYGSGRDAILLSRPVSLASFTGHGR